MKSLQDLLAPLFPGSGEASDLAFFSRLGSIRMSKSKIQDSLGGAIWCNPFQT
jgi:hypothetical protein